jgi:hypothetical protein
MRRAASWHRFKLLRLRRITPPQLPCSTAHERSHFLDRLRLNINRIQRRCRVVVMIRGVERPRGAAVRGAFEEHPQPLDGFPRFLSSPPARHRRRQSQTTDGPPTRAPRHRRAFVIAARWSSFPVLGLRSRGQPTRVCTDSRSRRRSCGRRTRRGWPRGRAGLTSYVHPP